MRIVNSVFAGNNAGVQADAGAFVSLGNSDSYSNNTGFIGAWTSFGNNRLAGNVSDGTASTAAGAPSSDLGQK